MDDTTMHFTTIRNALVPVWLLALVVVGFPASLHAQEASDSVQSAPSSCVNCPGEGNQQTPLSTSEEPTAKTDLSPEADKTPPVLPCETLGTPDETTGQDAPETVTEETSLTHDEPMEMPLSESDLIPAGPAEIPRQGFCFPKRPKLRPCCAFGHSLRTTVSGNAVPVKVDNILYPNRLGHHSYESIGLQSEMNGLIYTCRGGVIDFAHIRDYADWTAYLYERILQALPRGAVISLPDEGARRDLVIHRPQYALSTEETKDLALLLAQRVAFQLSVWHEIVTWYDHRSVALFSERLSSFSPEDLFSNALGTQIGAMALRSDKPYNDAVDEVLNLTVQSLAPLYNRQTKRTLNMVDGVWWDRSKTMPDMTMVMRRNLDVGDVIRPWVIPDDYSPYCRDRNDEPASIPLPLIGPQKLPLTDVYELRFFVKQEEMPKFIPPERAHEWIAEEDFPALIETIRYGVKNLFGPLGDKPTITLQKAVTLSTKAGNFDPEHPCGMSDPSCSFTRNEEVNGINIMKLRTAGGNFPGMMFGGTLAEGSTMGGLFSVLNLNSAVDFTDGTFSLHAKAVESPVLFFCSVEAEDGSGRTEVDYPFVNPFEVKCLPGAYWGLKLDLLEMIYSSSLDSFGFRPIEAGVVLNAMGNGFQPQFLRRRFLFSLGLSPEILLEDRGDRTQRNRPFTSYFSMMYDHIFWDNRLTWKSFASIRDDLTETERFNVDAGMKLQYNLLWSRRDFRGGDPLHSIVSFGLEVAMAYWYQDRMSIPSMISSAPIMMSNDFIPDRWHITGLGLFYIETTIPKLGMF